MVLIILYHLQFGCLENSTRAIPRVLLNAPSGHKGHGSHVLLVEVRQPDRMHLVGHGYRIFEPQQRDVVGEDAVLPSEHGKDAIAAPVAAVALRQAVVVPPHGVGHRHHDPVLPVMAVASQIDLGLDGRRAPVHALSPLVGRVPRDAVSGRQHPLRVDERAPASPAVKFAINIASRKEGLQERKHLINGI
jgi:hypothetical protein